MSVVRFECVASFRRVIEHMFARGRNGPTLRRPRVARWASLLLLLVVGVIPLAKAGPRRICSVSLAGDEYLALLVDSERVVCVSRYVDDVTLSNVVGHFPPSIARVSSQLEKLIVRDPDLMLVAPWNSQDFLAALKRSGVRALVLANATSFDEIRGELLRLGEAFGGRERAVRLAAELDNKLKELAGLAARPEGSARLRVLSFSHAIVAGQGTTIDELICRAGALNAAAEIGVHGYSKVAMERIIALDPDVLLLGFDEGESLQKLLRAYPLLAKTRAARQGRIIILSPHLLTTVTPFLADGALELARRLRAFEGLAP